jgi:hypothetical protein
MSIALMTLTWQTALPLNQKAALLALSDWANDEGASLHPSIYALSERLTCSERTAQRLIRDLEEGQWIAVVGNHNGGRPGATRNYRINVRKLRAEAFQEEERRAEVRRQHRHVNADNTPDPFETGDKPCKTGDTGVTGDKLTGVTNQAETGDKSGSRRVTNRAETGDTGVTLTTIEPSIEPPKNHQCARTAKPAVVGRPDGVTDQTWADWLQLRKRLKAEVTLTALDGIAREAAKAGYSLEDALMTCCANGWRGFRAEWVHRGGRGQAPQETAYQQQMRQRVAALTPRFAAQGPQQHAGDFFRDQAIDVPAHEVPVARQIGGVR